MNKFKLKDKVKLITRRHGETDANPVWGGKEGHIKGTVTQEHNKNKDGGEMDVKVLWENGKKNNYEENDLEMLPKINNLAAAAKALKRAGPKEYYTVCMKIETKVLASDIEEANEIAQEDWVKDNMTIMKRNMEIINTQKQ